MLARFVSFLFMCLFYCYCLLDDVLGAQKNKEKEERLRLVREKQQEELKRRMEGLREANSRSEEFRKRLEEDRKRRVERLRQTEEEHRVIVENRRKRIIEEENVSENS